MKNKKQTNDLKDSAVPNKEIVDKALTECVGFLRSKGIASFLLLFAPTDGLAVSHIENIKVRDAFRVLIAGFDQVVKLELERSNDKPKEYQDIHQQLLLDFHSIIKNANDRLLIFKENGEKIPEA